MAPFHSPTSAMRPRVVLTVAAISGDEPTGHLDSRSIVHSLDRYRDIQPTGSHAGHSDLRRKSHQTGRPRRNQRGPAGVWQHIECLVTENGSCLDLFAMGVVTRAAMRRYASVWAVANAATDYAVPGSEDLAVLEGDDALIPVGSSARARTKRVTRHSGVPLGPRKQ